MAYKIPNGLLPLYLSKLFQINSTVMILGLREGGKSVLLPKPDMKYLLKCFKFSGARLWNNLSLYTKLQNSLASLKRELPTFSCN